MKFFLVCTRLWNDDLLRSFHLRQQAVESGESGSRERPLPPSNAIHTLGNLYPRQRVDPDASMERGTWMDQSKVAEAQLVSAIDTDHVKFKNQDKEEILDHQNRLILLNLRGVETSTNMQNAQVERSLFAQEECMHLIPDVFFLVSVILHNSYWMRIRTRSVFHSVCVPEKGI